MMPTSTWPQRSAASQNTAIAERVAGHAHREVDQKQRADRERGPRHITQIAQKPGHALSSSARNCHDGGLASGDSGRLADRD